MALSIVVERSVSVESFSAFSAAFTYPLLVVKADAFLIDFFFIFLQKSLNTMVHVVTSDLWSLYTVNDLFTYILIYLIIYCASNSLFLGTERKKKKKIVYSIHFIVYRYLKTRIIHSGEHRIGKIPRSRPWYDTIE